MSLLDTALVALLVALLAGAGATLLVHARTGVAPIPASRAARRAAVALLREALAPAPAPPAPGAAPGIAPGTIYELGCGFGGLAFDLARAFPTCRVVAIELSPVPFALARLRRALARGLTNLEVRPGDFFAVPLCDACAVATYLMLRPMARLAAKLDAELAPGTPVLALAFRFRGRAPAAVRAVPGLFPMDAALYRWPGAAGRGGAPDARQRAE